MNQHLDRRFLLGGLAGLGGAAGISALAAMAKAGPLDPPAGPVASTAKPLAELEPRTAVNIANTPGDSSCTFRITQPGSYYLTGNVTGTALKHGIRIDASNVTLDLNGFALVGVSNSIDGVTVGASTLRGITVTNGTVSGWGGPGVSGGDGINLGIMNCANARVDRVTAIGNGRVGIRVGPTSVVTDCVTQGNAGGIIAGRACVVSRCSAADSGGPGINAAEGSTIEACAATACYRGITAASYCTLIGCNAWSNTLSGIQVSGGSRLHACTSSANGEHGIEATFNATIDRCTANSNVTSGIITGGSSQVTNCTAMSNGRLGGAGGSGILTLGSSLIEDNVSSGNGYGYRTEGVHTVVRRNTASANNTDWFLAAGTLYGPIINLVAAMPAAVNGTSAPGVLTSTDPNANFTV